MSGILSKEYTTEMLHINRSRWQWYSYINDQDGILLADDYIQIKLASPYIIRKWASSRFKNKIWIGYVTSGETLHYKTLKPVVGGLFCERIFGPINDWQCHCGRLRYARAPELPLWCKNCKVKICRSKKRRSKLGAIRLHVPVLHLWYARATKRINPLYRLLFFSNKELKKVYADEWLVLAQQSFITPCTLATSFFTRFEWRQMLLIMRGRLTYFPKDSFAPWKLEPLYDRNPVDFFEGGLLSNHSTYSLYTLLERIDLGEFARFATVRLKLLRKSELLLRKSQVLFFLGFRRIATTKVLSKLFDKVKKETKKTFEKKHNFLSTLTLACESFSYQTRPEWIFLFDLPVLPPDLRPILKVENGSLASSDLNDLYRFLVYRTNRLGFFIKKEIPKVIILKEISLVQASVNAIIDNTSLKFPVKRSVMYEVFEPLRSLSNRIVGKMGRFRQNLLGKRVDYSGRSVIIVGPTLHLWECGLPKEMAFVLFYSFLLYELIEQKFVTSLLMAKNFIDLYPNTSLKILRRIITFHPILLNRAPTLHRMGIQSFFPKIISGKAIQLHPFVCPAFNADFDGDQMAVHIPLSTAAILEARLLLLAPNNWLSPASGEPSLLPSQDIVLGIYYLTLAKKSNSGRNLSFQSEFFFKIHSLVWITQNFTREANSLTCSVNHQKIHFNENHLFEMAFLTQSGIGYTLYSSSIVITDSFGNSFQSFLLTTRGRALFHRYLPDNTI